LARHLHARMPVVKVAAARGGKGEQGTIIRLIKDRGFGFVSTANGKEVFLHASTLPQGVFDTLQEGQAVSFDIENDPGGRGERAANVEILD
jgi:CspA family cold shock protein